MLTKVKVPDILCPDMITPTQITKFDRTDTELQSFWLFGAFCAGKNSDYAAACLAKLLNKIGDKTPFEYLRDLGETNIHNALVAARIGQYSRLTRFIMESLDLDLRTATLSDLTGVFGIGPKTARFFLVHSRSDASHAILDTHILKYLREKSDSIVETQTPTTKKRYEELEKMFLFFVYFDFPHMTVADIDLMLWMKYSGRLQEDLFSQEIDKMVDVA
jgi:thermostable 8-oxoguanine DNA glycosylase